MRTGRARTSRRSSSSWSTRACPRRAAEPVRRDGLGADLALVHEELADRADDALGRVALLRSGQLAVREVVAAGVLHRVVDVLVAAGHGDPGVQAAVVVHCANLGLDLVGERREPRGLRDEDFQGELRADAVLQVVHGVGVRDDEHHSVAVGAQAPGRAGPVADLDDLMRRLRRVGAGDGLRGRSRTRRRAAGPHRGPHQGCWGRRRR